MKIVDIAKVCHEVNRAYCCSIGDFSQPEWDVAPNWQKTSAVNGVTYHLQNEDSTPADSHNSWLQEKRLDGWKYGKIKDDVKKEHPCFLEYVDLPNDQKSKDYIFKEIIENLKSFLNMVQ